MCVEGGGGRRELTSRPSGPPPMGNVVSFSAVLMLKGTREKKNMCQHPSS